VIRATASNNPLQLRSFTTESIMKTHLSAIRSGIRFSAALLCLALPTAQAQTWRVVSANNALIPTAGFSAPTAPNFFLFSQFDGGQGQILAQTSTAGAEGRWLRRQGSFVRYATVDATGSLGPNRSGAEANHVFRALRFGHDRSGGDTNISIAGKAGAPGVSSVGLPNAAWRFNGTQNNEFARALLDNQLGPGLGAGWFFADEELNLLPRNDGSILIFNNITSPVSFTRRGVVRNTATGNVTCALIGSTLASVSPNIGNANPFEQIEDIVTTDGNRTFILARTQFSAIESGVWEICNGAPVVRLLSERGGAFAPNVGIPGAVFAQFYGNVRTSSSGELVFGALYRESAIAVNVGLFKQSNGLNNLIAKRDDTSAALGPNWLGSRFSTFEHDSLIAAGQHVAFEATVVTPSSNSVTGIFRIRPGGNPEPVALEGVLAFGPAAGQTFTRFDRWVLLSNGDIVADCAVANGPSGLYRFRAGSAPQLLLAVGTTVPVQTTSGLVQASVVNYAVALVDGDSAQSSLSWAGVDSWAGTDGTLLVSATLNVGGTSVGTLMTFAIDVGAYLKDGFE
jgi:hypothetical protein